MIEFFAAYLKQLETLHADMNQAINDLPAEALNWSPGPGMNSVAVLAAHTAGSERYWIGDVVARDDSQRDRAAEFRTQAASAAELITRLEVALAHSRNVLGQLTLEDLDAKRSVPSDQREVTVAWALVHALEHVATHLGHMQMMRDVWQAGLPSDEERTVKR